MMDDFDISKFKKVKGNPYYEFLIKNGYSVIIYEDETETKIVKQYFVSPEEVAERVAKREANRKLRQAAIEEDMAIHQV
jgi:hypothetical protein